MAEQTRVQERQVEHDAKVGPVVTGRPAMERSPLARPKVPLPGPEASAPGYGFLLDASVFTSWFRGVGVLSGEMTRFMLDRLSEDMAAWSMLAACKTPEEAIECQRRFAEKAPARYAEEIATLSRLMLNLATEGLQSFCVKSDR
jgi:hypothetical protein